MNATRPDVPLDSLAGLMPGSPVLTALIWLLALLALGDAARRARWQAPLREHLAWAALTLLVALLQRARFSFGGMIELHYLGAAWLALVVGYPRAILSLSAVLAVRALSNDPMPFSWAAHVLLEAVMPVWLMYLVVQAFKRWLPANLFVFLIGVGLPGTAFVNAVQVLVTVLAMILGGVAHGDGLWRLWHEYLPFALLLAWGEALIEGMLLSIFVVYLPGSVRLFDEHHYLRPRPRRGH